VSDVLFPRTPDSLGTPGGRRSSAAFGRAVVADALRAVDPAAADAAEREADWRRGYPRYFRALVEAGLTADDAGYAIAAAGLRSVHERMRVSRDGGEAALDEAFEGGPGQPLETATVAGSGKPERELTLPVRGDLLRGDSLHRQLDAWVAAGTIEPSCAEAVRDVAANPDWLDLSDQRLVVLGAGAEMGPLPAVLGWGSTVVGIDLPRPDLQARIDALARASADLLTQLPAVAEWLLGIEGRLVLGDYVYAPGAAYPRLSAAVDKLGVHLRERRNDVALAFLATPTDVFAVPAEAVRMADVRYRARSGRAKLVGAMSGRRLLQPNYPARSSSAETGISDSMVAQQGPNYALAKRIQRWRASLARRDGVVSFAVAPPTRTKSVLSNRLLAAAYAGAHLFDVEVFEPATANKLMAVLLVHQLRRPRPAAEAVWRDEAVAAAHGGLWRTAYAPRSALGLAAVRGVPSALRRPAIAPR
jgi:hypothetical protein